MRNPGCSNRNMSDLKLTATVSTVNYFVFEMHAKAT